MSQKTMLFALFLALFAPADAAENSSPKDCSRCGQLIAFKSILEQRAQEMGYSLPITDYVAIGWGGSKTPISLIVKQIHMTDSALVENGCSGKPEELKEAFELLQQYRSIREIT